MISLPKRDSHTHFREAQENSHLKVGELTTQRQGIWIPNPLLMPGVKVSTVWCQATCFNTVMLLLKLLCEMLTIK